MNEGHFIQNVVFAIQGTLVISTHINVFVYISSSNTELKILKTKSQKSKNEKESIKTQNSKLQNQKLNKGKIDNIF